MSEAVFATGRRKNAVARVRILPGTGKIDVNGKDLSAYFMNPSLEQLVVAPFKLTETEGKFDLFVNVAGGGDLVEGNAVAALEKLGFVLGAGVGVGEAEEPALGGLGVEVGKWF